MKNKIVVDSKTITTSLVVLLFLLVNWLSYGMYIRFDLSRTGRFRLTSATKDILGQLPDNASLEAFFSSEVPDAYLQQVKFSRDFLREYASASDGKVNITFIDPDSSESSKERAQALSIPQSQITVQGDNDFEVKRIYLAVALSYGDKIEIIQNVVNSRRLEYELTSKIYRMAYPGERGIAFLSNHGNISLNNENRIESLDFASGNFESFYGKMKPVNTSEADIPSDVTTLFVIGPTNLQPMDKFRIDQFIMRGGNVIFSVAGVNVDLNSGRAVPLSPDVLDFIKNYGFIIGSDMIFEPKNFMSIPRPHAGNPFGKIPYPVWIYSKSDTLNENHVITRGVPGLFIPWTSSLKVDESKLIKNNADNKDEKNKKEASGTIRVLAKTSPDAWSQSQNLYLSPEYMVGFLKDELKDTQKNKGTFNLIGYADAKFKSYFNKENRPPKEAPRSYLRESEKNAKILTVSSSHFMTTQLLQFAGQANFANLPFLLSTLDVMNGLEELVDSRRKNISDPALPPTEKFWKRIWTSLNFILPLLFIMGFGFMRLFERKRISRRVYSKN